VQVLEFETVNYTGDFKEEIKQVFSKKMVDLEKLCLLNGWIGGQHGEMVNDCLKKWGVNNNEVDISASHGQTIYHAPKRLHGLEKFGNSTLQIGDGDHLAVKTGIITLSDFRQKHISAGGEGAPLAVYGDYILFGNKEENRVMLNIGGIANFTYLPANANITEVFSTDIGAGNTLMDAYIQQNFPNKFYDENSLIARKGKTNNLLLAELKTDDFFNQSFPKSTGPELFNLHYIDKAKNAAGINEMTHEDMMATLTKFTADMIVAAFATTINKDENYVVYASGGGIHNPLLMEYLKTELPTVTFRDFKELGINPDAKEAILFAVLANETLCGNNNYDENKTVAMPTISMGKISFPC
jgi:anhydro-N-acetylmuramic acid kinase